MRMRKKKNLLPRMEACSSLLVADPRALRGRWRELLPDARELRVELGCGKGRFTAETAAAEPDVLLIAVEKVPDAMVVAMERAQAAGLHNVFFVDGDAACLPEFFAPGEVDRIYINFCNPWTKRPKYAKRRLTHPRQLMQYREFLVDGGEIWFKTDDDALFEESLPYFDACGFELRYQTGDLHAAGVTPNYVSEHEMKFTALGVPIKFARFAKKPGKVELDPVRWVMPGAFAKLREDDETEEP